MIAIGDIISIAKEVNRSKNLFLKRCEKQYILDEGLLMLLDKYDINNGFYQDFSPHVILQTKFGEFKEGDFTAQYGIKVNLSKTVDNVIYVHYSYKVKNLDPKGIDPYFESDNEMPLTLEQQTFDEELNSYLNKRGFYRLSYSEANKIIPFEHDGKIFDEEPSLELLIFNDVSDFLD
jgi:hypothetical protein